MSNDLKVSGEIKVTGDYIGRDKITTEIHYAAPPTGAQALHQLPPAPADFTGRQAELAALLQAVQTGGAAILSLQGQGGIGKTALALVLADRLKAHFPSAGFFIPLRGASQSPLPHAEALAHLIRAYHPTIKLPDTIAELQGLYRSVLAGQKAIVLLDDARDKAQVAPFLPAPAGCLLVVTSRQQFTLPGQAQPLDLADLPPEEARALVLRLAPRLAGLPEAAALADQVARLCGCLPQALTAAAAAVQEQVTLAPGDYVRRLHDERRRLELEGLKVEGVPLSMAASFAMSYDLLPAPARERWRQLAIFPADFDEAAAQRVWGLDADAAQDGLGELVRYSLLEWQAERRRFSLHNLAQLYANSLLSDAERAAAGLRHAEHYRDVTMAANALYLKGGEAMVQGLALFDREWANIRAGQAWAVARAEQDEAAARLAIQYPNAMEYWVELRLQAQARITWLTAAVTAARKLGDQPAEGIALILLGNAYGDLGDVQRAIELYEQRLTIARAAGDRQGEGNALGSLGIAHAELGHTEHAIELYEQTLVILREIGDRRGEGIVLINLGNAFAVLGHAERAIALYEQALITTREIGDREGESAALGELGNAYATLGDTHRALALYEQQLPIAREIGDRQAEANTSWNLGLAYEKEGDLPRAIAALEVCVAFEREIGHPEAEADAAKVEALRLELTRPA